MSWLDCRAVLPRKREAMAQSENNSRNGLVTNNKDEDDNMMMTTITMTVQWPTTVSNYLKRLKSPIMTLHRNYKKSEKERLKRSPDDSRKLIEEMMQTWRGVVICSRYGRKGSSDWNSSVTDGQTSGDDYNLQQMHRWGYVRLPCDRGGWRSPVDRTAVSAEVSDDRTLAPTPHSHATSSPCATRPVHQPTDTQNITSHTEISALQYTGKLTKIMLCTFLQFNIQKFKFHNLTKEFATPLNGVAEYYDEEQKKS